MERIRVPRRYKVLFVLTKGDKLIITSVNQRPRFEVNKPGVYRIHTLVYNPNSTSPDFLDLSIVEPGQTTGFDVLEIIEKYGICADLDAIGAKVRVIEGQNKTLLGDLVFYDLNGNNIKDPREPGVPNIRVELLTCPAPSKKLTQVRTDEQGHYLFEDLAPGEYYVKFSDIPEGFEFVEQDKGGNEAKDSDAKPDGKVARTSCFTVSEGQINLKVDAGIKKSPSSTELNDLSDDSSFDINEADEGIILSAYPNPTIDVFSLSLKGPVSVASISIINLMGQEVYSTTLHMNDNVIDIDIRNWANGIYYIRAIHEDGVSEIKLQKNN